MRIDQNPIDLDDIISDLNSVTGESDTFIPAPTTKPGVTAAVKTTTSSRPQTASLQSKRQAHKETKDQGAAMKVQGTKIAGNIPKNKENSNKNSDTPTAQQSNYSVAGNTSTTKASSKPTVTPNQSSMAFEGGPIDDSDSFHSVSTS